MTTRSAVARTSRLRLYYLAPVFFFAVSLDQLAVDRDKLMAFTANDAWLTALLQMAQEKTNLGSPWNLRRDQPTYPQSPSPEKQPINATYFERHGSLVSNAEACAGGTAESISVNDVSYRIHECGARGSACRWLPVYLKVGCPRRKRLS